MEKFEIGDIIKFKVSFEEDRYQIYAIWSDGSILIRNIHKPSDVGIIKSDTKYLFTVCSKSHCNFKRDKVSWKYVRS